MISAMKKSREGSWGMECLNMVAVEDTAEKIAFEPRPKEDEEPNVPG